MTQYRFEKEKKTGEVWGAIEQCGDSTLFHSRAWHRHLNGNDFVVRVSEARNGGEERVVGWFVGNRRWAGVGIVGAPFGGSGTYLGGLCTTRPIDTRGRVQIYKQLAAWCFAKRHAAYLQVTDWQLRKEYDEYQNDWNDALLTEEGVFHTPRATWFLDLSLPEEELWKKLSYKSCRYCINKAVKEGLEVRFIDIREEIPGFVDLLNSQIQDVSERKGVARHVHQNKKRLLSICNNLFPDRVLMIQVTGTDGKGERQVMSSALFGIDRNVSTYYAGASFHRFMKYCPNEIMVWEAMKELHRRGVKHLIMGDTAPYKRKFGPRYAYLPMMVFSKYPFLRDIRRKLKDLYWKLRQRHNRT